MDHRRWMGIALTVLAAARMPQAGYAAGQTITVLASQDWIKDAEKELGRQFEEETGIHVDYQILPADQYQSNLMIRLNNGEGPDLFGAQSGPALSTTYRVQETAVDLSKEAWMTSYESSAARETSVGSVNYGLTYFDTTTDYYLIYNKRLFRSAGISVAPKTFEDFKAACQKLMEAGSVPIYEPMADGWHHTMLWTENSQVFEKRDPGLFERLNRNEETFAGNEVMKRSLEQLCELYACEYFGTHAMSDTFADAADQLAGGAYAMCMLKPGALRAIVESPQNRDGFTEEDFGMMLLPLCDNTYLNIHPTGPSRFIYAASDHIEEAKQYLAFLTRPESVQYMIDHEPTVEDLPIIAGQTAEHTAATRAFLEAFEEAQTGLVIQDEVTYVNEQWMEISANLAAMFRGDMTPDQVLEAIDEGRAALAYAAGDPGWQK